MDYNIFLYGYKEISIDHNILLCVYKNISIDYNNSLYDYNKKNNRFLILDA